MCGGNSGFWWDEDGMRMGAPKREKGGGGGVWEVKKMDFLTFIRQKTIISTNYWRIFAYFPRLKNKLVRTRPLRRWEGEKSAERPAWSSLAQSNINRRWERPNWLRIAGECHAKKRD